MQSDPVVRVLLALILACGALLVARDFAEPDAGRYSVVGMRVGQPLLVRVDSATGRTWKLAIRDGDTWVPFREPTDAEAAPEAVPEAAAGPTEPGAAR